MDRTRAVLLRGQYPRPWRSVVVRNGLPDKIEQEVTTAQPKQILSRLAVAALFVVFGLSATVPVYQAQCHPNDYLTSGTAVIKVLGSQSVLLVVLQHLRLSIIGWSASETFPDCLLAGSTAADAVDGTKMARSEAAGLGCTTCLVEPSRFTEAAKKS